MRAVPLVGRDHSPYDPLRFRDLSAWDCLRYQRGYADPVGILASPTQPHLECGVLHLAMGSLLSYTKWLSGIGQCWPIVRVLK
jgi:hypothetical protein